MAFLFNIGKTEVEKCRESKTRRGKGKEKVNIVIPVNVEYGSRCPWSQIKAEKHIPMLFETHIISTGGGVLWQCF